MVILDLHQVMLSNLFMQLGMSKSTQVDMGMIRHMVLNSIRAYKIKFKDYGELIIACDDSRYWRKDVFPYYKANRKKNRDESPIDWKQVFECLNAIRDELKEHFPYRVIQVAGAEADDIIATLVHNFGDQFGKKLMIISADKDFIQLHDHISVEQYDPIRKKAVRHGNPKEYLKEHIVKGDSGDGVPNMLSPDDCLVVGVRQKTMTEKRLQRLMAGEFETPEEERNYARNKMLIDMTEIPVGISAAILESYYDQENKPRKDLFNYFVKHRLKNLMEAINDF